MSLFAGENPNLGVTASVNNAIIYPYTEVDFILVGTAPATTGNYGLAFVADRAYQLVSAQEVHTTAGTGGACTVDLEKLTGTQAPASGVVMELTAFDLTLAANTVQSTGPSATIANAKLAKGDRIAIKLTGTPTSVANLCISIVLQAI